MAAAADWLSSLPGSWGFGITQGGRVYFINEEAKSTTWLHPVTGEAVLTGHRKTPDLPTGWEEGFTFEGARYYINHNERKVTCKHPVSGQPSQDNCIFVVNDHPTSTMTSQEKKDRTVSVTSDTSNCNALPAAPHTSPLTRTSRSLRKVHNFGKRSNSIKRNPNAPVTVRNWLYKKANSGMKLWKKRWFVLSDLCLFYYRDEKEEGVLGSILLPSFQISSVTPEDHINRMFAFKASHPNMRTYYFCTDTGRETELWIKAMKDASLAHAEPSRRTEMNTFENLSPLEMNHVPNHRLLIRPDITSNQRNKVDERKAREAERYGFQNDGQDRPLTKINSVRHQPGLPDYEILAAAQYRSAHTNGPDTRHVEPQGHLSETDGADEQRLHTLHTESERVIQRTNSMLQLEQWIRAQRDKGPDEECRGVVSYQTLPRNMPSYRSQVVPRYPEGYRTLPRNPKPRPESLCSTAGVGYDRTLPTMCSDEKRRSVRDDTMWQLYEWQQRQFYNKQTTLRRHSSLTSPKTMIQISEQTLHSIPLSPSHGSISGYHTYSPHRPYRSEVSSPVQRSDVTIDRRQKTLPNKHATFLADRRSVPAGLSLQPITTQGLQDKTPEELTLLLIKLRRQQAELGAVREHALAQLLRLKQQCSPKDEILSRHLQRNLLYVDYQMKENEPLISMVHAMIENSALRPHLYQQMSQEDCRAAHKFRSEDVDVDAKLSQLCEQDKVVQALEQKLQQLHKEKYTLEQALLSASQEIEMNAENPTAIQNVVLQRDELQSGLLSTCREVSRATTELERAWREYERLERDVTTARNQMREQLNRLGEVQTESAGIQRAQMQKEIWRIQDVMEGLSKHKEQRRSKGDADMFPSGKISHEGPDYRLYKSEPELTTVAEVDESNSDDRVDTSLDLDAAGGKGSHFPVGVVPPRTKSPPLESTTIASYVTLRKNKKLEPKPDRPRSAVEHLCIADSGRHRMTLEEQLERMRRHQQACLKEKRKSLSFLGTIEPSPSLSRENSLKERQMRRREEAALSYIQDIENAVLEENLSKRESPAQEITRLKEATITSNARSAVKVENSAVSETTPEPKTKEDATEDAASEVQLADAVQTFGGNSAQVPSRKVESIQSKVSAGEPERAGILFSYEFSADTLRRHTSLDAGNLSLPEPQSAQPQLTEGSHFMCV